MLYVPSPKSSTTTVVTEQFLARNRLGKRQRAKLAADIGAGKVIIDGFTAKQLAAICRVSVPYIAQACNGGSKLPPDPVAKLLRDWNAANPEQRAAFARALGVDLVWDEMIAPVITAERAAQAAA
jgi:hypothetical protein